ncbi:MAG: DUF4339 domain-containing protein [Parachlamydiaceae bacterium]|nr:DUF4339 domain-containing protein [Parachlamydiaceae bacterium]
MVIPSSKNKKEWWIRVGDQQIGPLSIKELKKNIYFTPDTYVWKKGWKEWIQAKDVPQLNEAFKDDPVGQPLHENSSIKTAPSSERIETLDLWYDPYMFLLWIILMIMILLYTYNQFQKIHP